MTRSYHEAFLSSQAHRHRALVGLLLAATLVAALGSVTDAQWQTVDGTRDAPRTYPANRRATNLLSRQDVLQRVHLVLGYTNGTTARLKIVRVELKRFGDASGIRSGGFRMPLTSSDRQVYEITTSFSGPYEDRGNIWDTGTRVFVVDAATGHIFFSAIHAPMLHSGHVRAGHQPHPPELGATLPPH